MRNGLTASFARRFPNGPEIRIDSLRVAPGSGVTVLFGTSGSGKTTILRCLAGLMKPDEGRIEMNGEAWFDAPLRQSLRPQQRRVGFVPQEYLLFPHLTVEENIAYGLRPQNRSEQQANVEKQLHWLGLEGLAERLPHELSGGQQQRVALARAVASSPQMLLLDEPLSALDTPSRQRLRSELRQLLSQLEIPTLLVTHDRTEAVALGNQIVVLDQGRIQQAGPVADVFNHPANLTVAKVCGMETVVPGRIVGRADGMATVAIGDVKLLALADELAADTVTVHVCIRAEDVILTRDTASASSARNRLAARVVAAHREMPMARIELDCGFPLTALITRQSLEEFQLQPADQITVWIKAPHVHLIAT